MSEEVVGPIITQIGMGGVSGFLVGYIAKKLAKIVAVLAGLAFIALQYLAYKGIIQLNYDKLLLYAQRVVGRLPEEELLASILANIPFGGSFIVGLILGLRKG